MEPQTPSSIHQAQETEGQLLGNYKVEKSKRHGVQKQITKARHSLLWHAARLIDRRASCNTLVWTDGGSRLSNHWLTVGGPGSE